MKEVILEKVGSSLQSQYFRIRDIVTGTVIYSARHEVTCRDKAKRMKWEIVSGAPKVKIEML